MVQEASPRDLFTQTADDPQRGTEQQPLRQKASERRQSQQADLRAQPRASAAEKPSRSPSPLIVGSYDVPGTNKLTPRVSNISAGGKIHAASHQRLGLKWRPRVWRTGSRKIQRVNTNAVTPGISMIPFATTKVSSELHDPPCSR